MPPQGAGSLFPLGAPDMAQGQMGAAPAPQPQQPQAPQLGRDQIDRMVDIMAKKQQVDPELVRRMIGAESSYNPAAKSPKGAMGLMQLMPNTATRYGMDPLNPVQNLHMGILEIKRLLAKYDGNIPKALAAYNGGETALDQGKKFPETGAYLNKILQGYRPPQEGLGFEVPKEPMQVPWALKTEQQRAADWAERRKEQASPQYQQREQKSLQDLTMMGRPLAQQLTGANPMLPQQHGFTGAMTDMLKGMTGAPSTAMMSGMEAPLGGPQSLVAPVQDIYGRLKGKDYSGAAGSALMSAMLMGGGEELLRRGLGGEGTSARGATPSPGPETPTLEAPPKQAGQMPSAGIGTAGAGAGATPAEGEVPGARPKAIKAGRKARRVAIPTTLSPEEVQTVEFAHQQGLPVPDWAEKAYAAAQATKAPSTKATGLGAKPAPTVGAKAVVGAQEPGTVGQPTEAGMTGAREVKETPGRGVPMRQEQPTKAGQTVGAEPVRREPGKGDLFGLGKVPPEDREMMARLQQEESQRRSKEPPPQQAQAGLQALLQTRGIPPEQHEAALAAATNAWQKEVAKGAQGDPARAAMAAMEKFVPKKAPAAPKEPAPAEGAPAAPKPVSLGASGESAASLEGINRQKAEKAAGVTRVRIDTRSGKETPLVGVEAVDAKAGPYDRIVQRAGGKETLLEAGAKARAVSTSVPTGSSQPPEKEKAPVMPPGAPKLSASPAAPSGYEKAANRLGIPAKAIPRAVAAASKAFEESKGRGEGRAANIDAATKALLKIKREAGVLHIGGQKLTPLEVALQQWQKASGERMHEIQTENLGELARRKEQAFTRLDAMRKSFRADKDPARGLAFIDYIENGEAERQRRGVGLSPALESKLQAGKAKLSMEDRVLAMELKGMFQDSKTAIQGLGTGKLSHYVENYFPHMWERPGTSIGDKFRSLVSRKPLEGRTGYLKQRSIPTTLEGLDKGLKRVHNNPIDQALISLHEQNRYIGAHKMMKEAKQSGIAKFVRFGKRPPEGWQAINDKMFTSYQYSPKEKGFIQRGQYYMPAQAAKVLNRYLAPGLRGHLGYDAARSFSNVLNQVQLGLSGYHFGTTSVNSIVSQFALGVEQAAPGKFWTPERALSGLKKMATSPAAPFKNLVEGYKDMREYLDPQSQSAYAKALATAGGRISPDPVYRNSAIEKFFDKWAEHPWNKGPALLQAIPALIEAQAKPVMEWVVPTMKVGAFHDLASDIFAKASTEGWNHTQMRSALQKAWNSVDNRFGEVVYDNLGWNHIFQDLSHILVRSVGWNAGTFRELGASPKDLLSYSKDLITSGGKEGELSHRAAYTLALPALLGIVGGLYHWMHTGKAPQTAKDLYFPQTGKKTPQGLDERVSMPSYMKDIYSWKDHPLQTAINKANPGIELIYDMLNNRDFYGKPIRKIDDSFVQKAVKTGNYAAKQIMPFSFQNWAARQDKSLGTGMETFFGISPASKERERTPEQQADVERYIERKAEGGRQPRSFRVTPKF